VLWNGLDKEKSGIYIGLGQDGNLAQFRILPFLKFEKA
jgi:hypothetical protein